YLLSSQQFLTGEVELVSDGGNLRAASVDTPYRLHKAGAVYAQSCDWTPEEAVGFIKLLGQSTTLAGQVRKSQA
ncbi:MAG TPA: argininosuccinate synthase, partial [Xanthomonadales bacterium]|nr:argininosuccinate synthase [Xanthomonadales bacterium]